jgi:hypothetical protein
MARYEKISIEGVSFFIDENATKVLTNANIDRLNDMQSAIEGLTGQHEDYISAPTGGVVVDAEARAKINSIIAALVTSGVIDPES